MIDLAKKFRENLIDDFTVSVINSNGIVDFNPESDDDFLKDLSLLFTVNLNIDELNSEESKSILKNCNNDVSIIINAQCRNTDFNQSTTPLLIRSNCIDYEFELLIVGGCVSRDFNLSVSIFYSGSNDLSQFYYWPSISLLSSVRAKTWHFENYNNPIFNVVKNPSDGVKLVSLNLNNIMDILECDVEDIGYYAVIDTTCIIEKSRNEKFLIASILYEYIEFIVFKPELAETLISGVFESNSIGRNMQLFMTEFMSAEFSLRNNFTLENIVMFRNDLINFKGIVYKYIKEILK